MSSDDDTMTPRPRSTGERLVAVESGLRQARKELEDRRVEAGKMFVRLDEDDKSDAALAVTIDNLCGDVKTLKTKVQRHAMIVYAGYSVAGLLVLLLKLGVLHLPADATDQKHWQFLSANRQEINALRHESGLPPAERPDLGD